MKYRVKPSECLEHTMHLSMRRFDSFYVILYYILDADLLIYMRYATGEFTSPYLSFCTSPPLPRFSCGCINRTTRLGHEEVETHVYMLGYETDWTALH